MGTTLTGKGEWSRALTPLFQRFPGGAAALVGIIANPIYPECRIPFDSGPDVNERRSAHILPPESKLSGGIGCHHDPNSVIVSSDQRRDPGRRFRWWKVKAGADIDCKHQVDR